MSYVFHAGHRVWKREGYASLAYSDGAKTEAEILAAIEAATDLSALSPELPAAARNWPMEYHFSRQRHCLVRPLPIKAGDRVLELGCGCGAITRYLGEIGADVTAVEGSELRARSAAARCRDLPNVKVYVDDLTATAFDTPFDWVLLIGVLEYSPVYVKGADPVATYFDSARRHMKPDGRLVVAIENKLGLKYWNGCGEDHVGVRFFGINGLYGAGTPVTFGRKGLRDVFTAGGLATVEFLYPYPDYKMPEIVLAEAATSHTPPLAANLLSRCHSRDYQSPKPRLFSEPMVVESLDENGLIGEFANSFLAIGHNRPQSAISPSERAWIYSINARRPEFACETRIFAGNDPHARGHGLKVMKQRLSGNQADLRVEAGSVALVHRVGEETFHDGKLYMRRVNRALMSAKSLDNVVAAFMPWFALIKHLARCTDESKASSIASWVVSGEHWDAIAYNVVEEADAFAIIDREWVIDRDLPLALLLVRSCIAVYTGALWQHLEGVDLLALVSAVAARAGMSITQHDINAALQLEQALQSAITVPSGFSSPKAPALPLDRLMLKQQQQLAAAHAALKAKDDQIRSLQSKLAARA